MKKLILFLLSGMTIMACKTDLVSRIGEEDMANGGYIRTVTPYPVANSTFSVSKANMGGTRMEFLAEAVTPDHGAWFASYDLSIAFVDATPANGTKNVAARALKSLPASGFTPDATTLYPRATITVTGTEALTATGLTAADVSAGDRFDVTGVMRLTDGRTFTASNTGANITGGAFYSSPFYYRINVAN
ncbi:hypothetical protein [Spirosoma sp. KUDC1026]|uniref:hypothetical protein n=1 Tax=Spirosoma sp. KUDC1026 TaxID=2745947 RepID=UPI00159BBA4A|nr:hypothetical protein [Spirosoma sp. KUDC1026]QKZ11135.1 hypothetical protein HU175_00160 [Spirosoma sp. KUDC1026]